MHSWKYSSSTILPPSGDIQKSLKYQSESGDTAAIVKAFASKYRSIINFDLNLKKNISLFCEVVMSIEFHFIISRPLKARKRYVFRALATLPRLKHLDIGISHIPCSDFYLF
jgi:hypothetical protein